MQRGELRRGNTSDTALVTTLLTDDQDQPLEAAARLSFSQLQAGAALLATPKLLDRLPGRVVVVLDEALRDYVTAEPRDAALVAILRGGRVIVPQRDDPIEGGDELVFIAPTEAEETFPYWPEMAFKFSEQKVRRARKSFRSMTGHWFSSATRKATTRPTFCSRPASGSSSSTN